MATVVVRRDFHARGLFVLVQVGLEGEGLAAPVARERLQVGMRLDVGAQVRLVRERLVADLARERLLTCQLMNTLHNDR